RGDEVDDLARAPEEPDLGRGDAEQSAEPLPHARLDGAPGRPDIAAPSGDVPVVAASGLRRAGDGESRAGGLQIDPAVVDGELGREAAFERGVVGSPLGRRPRHWTAVASNSTSMSGWA